jgi:hypothetical protein
MPDSISLAPADQVTLARLDDQIAWYSHKSALNQRRYKVLKVLTIASAAVIPVVTTAGIPKGSSIAAGLGVLIAMVEGIQQLNQYNVNWTSYRSTSEALKHEKYLYLAKAGPYRSVENASVSLAERIEALVSQEGSKWLTVQSAKVKDETGGSAT